MEKTAGVVDFCEARTYFFADAVILAEELQKFVAETPPLEGKAGELWSSMKLYVEENRLRLDDALGKMSVEFVASKTAALKTAVDAVGHSAGGGVRGKTWYHNCSDDKEPGAHFNETLDKVSTIDSVAKISNLKQALRQ